MYAEVAGYGATSEAYHMVMPQEDGRESARTMELALEDAGLAPSRVDYINAHATATPVGDPVEVRAIRRVLKRHANRVLVNATKSLLGHTLGAAGAIGAVTCVLSLTTGQLRRSRSRVRAAGHLPPGAGAPAQGRAAECLRVRQQQCVPDPEGAVRRPERLLPARG
jgi:3-oxoacyl-(acyl-carrier-protein) synthase